MNKLYRGFTLIEILVVISIIGILSAVLYANFSTAREEARNKAMQAELKEVQLALELYKAQYNEYPPAASVGGACSGTILGGIDWAKTNTCGNTPVIDGLTPEFIVDLPSHQDSNNPSCVVQYKVKDDRSWYKLTAENCHEGATSAADGVQQDNELARCPGSCSATGVCDPSTSGFYESYAIYSAGGECEP